MQMGTSLSPLPRGRWQPGPATGSCLSQCCLLTASCLQLTALLLPLALTFFSTTNSFSAAVRLLISSSYLWKETRQAEAPAMLNQQNPPFLARNPPIPFWRAPKQRKDTAGTRRLALLSCLAASFLLSLSRHLLGFVLLNVLPHVLQFRLQLSPLSH